jgi:predicted ATP-grasp superfamily ATP-dependent carboligase
MMTVVVTDTHTRMALAAVRELGEAGYDVTSVCRRGVHPLGHASKYAKRRITLPDEGYAEALLALGNKKENVLLPTGMDTLVQVSERRHEFASSFSMLVPGKEALAAASDKPAVAETARRLGLHVPKTYNPGAPRFPCVIKYRDGERLGLRAERRYAIVKDSARYEAVREAMRRQAAERANVCQAGELLVTEYIAGGAFGVSAVLDQNSEPLSVFCHKRLREYPVSGGPACCAEAVWHPGMAQSALALLKALKLQGFAMVEFKGSPEKPYVLEVNPRVWGTYPLARHCRAGMAQAYVRGATGESKTFALGAAPYRRGVRMQYLANDLLGHTTAAICDLFNPGVKGGVFDWRDLPGSWAYTKGLLRKGGSA